MKPLEAIGHKYVVTSKILKTWNHDPYTFKKGRVFIDGVFHNYYMALQYICETLGYDFNEITNHPENGQISSMTGEYDQNPGCDVEMTIHHSPEFGYEY